MKKILHLLSIRIYYDSTEKKGKYKVLGIFEKVYEMGVKAHITDDRKGH